MIKINENFLKLPESYLFSEVASRISKFREKNPGADIIRMDIGDVTLPLPETVINAMHKAVDDLATTERFRGYGPEQGYLFLREAIAENDYRQRGLGITPDEIFVSDGAKSDLGNLGDILGDNIKVAVADPGYPVYADSTVLRGLGGELKSGRWSRIEYLECNAENGFKPSLPEECPDLIYLCSPANPTGVALTKDDLRKWVEYARANKILIVYDSAYESYVVHPFTARSIYEIDGADEIAIEVRSFSKTAGFTGVRCGYTVVPHRLKGTDGVSGKEVELNKLWNRRQSTKFNGASYISQRAAESIYSSEGKEEIKRNVAYYLGNASVIRESLRRVGFETWGGEDSPYIWARKKGYDDSWQLFTELLERCHISCTPGSGFGSAGEGFIRLTGFNSLKNTREAMNRIINEKI